MESIESSIVRVANHYNNMNYFQEDPVIFPRKAKELYLEGKLQLQDVEITALLSAHLAWGRRQMVVRNCNRMMEEFQWSPYSYVMEGSYRSDESSLHRTIKWSHIAAILQNLKEFYSQSNSLEELTTEEVREEIFGSKSDKRAANKKIHLMRRWMVRDDDIVDLGLWREISPSQLIIPLDVHVHRTANELGITKRKSVDITTAMEITNYLKRIFPEDPTLGDFALFAFSASNKNKSSIFGGKHA